MSKGVLVFARNNSDIDYVKQALFFAKQVKKHLNLPVAIATDTPDYLESKFPFYSKYIDYVVNLEYSTSNYTYKTYSDGALESKRLEFKNNTRSLAYDITPFDETLLLDSDVIINDSKYLYCFDQPHNFLIYKNAYDLAGFRDTNEFDYISDTSVEFYWATCVFFRKSASNEIFFNLVKHVQENYAHYNSIFQMPYNVFRNDHAFSIALHIMSGYNTSDFAHPMPGKLYFISDKDIMIDFKDGSFKFLVEKEKYIGEYTPIKFSNNTVHVMNKYSLDRYINSESLDE
jgi:hypothetical protein